MKMKVLSLLVVLLAAVSAKASVSGSIGLATPILTTADASPTGNINTSNIFTLESLVTTDNSSGIFAGLPIQSFGAVTFDTTMGNSFKISDGEFGKFVSTTIDTITNVPGFLNLQVAGIFTPGTFETGVTGKLPGNLRISFTQTPDGVGEISFGGTLSVMSAVVVTPEPGTWLLFLTGIGLVLAGSRLRRFFVSEDKVL